MPCFYTGSAEGDAALSNSEIITKLTRMLCKTCQHLESNNVEIPNDVKEFWRKHKKIDKLR